jgi:acyl carrier protein
MISETLKKTILEVLRLEDFPLTESTVADDVPGWDSLSHARILAAAEKAFNVRFRSLEVIRIRNVGELQALIDKKRGQ